MTLLVSSGAPWSATVRSLILSSPGAIRGAHRERILKGAFGDVSKLDVTVNRMHVRSDLVGRSLGGGLTLIDDDDALRYELVLPPTAKGQDTAMEIRMGILRGSSAEFLPGRPMQTADRVVTYGPGSGVGLRGIGLIDRAAYRGSTGLDIRQDDAPPARKRSILWPLL